MAHFGDWLPETSGASAVEREGREREGAPGRNMPSVGDAGLSRAGPLLQPALSGEGVCKPLFLPSPDKLLATRVNLILLTRRMMKG